MRTLLKYWLPVVLWLGLIFIGSTDLLSAEHTSRLIGPILRWFNPHVSTATIAHVQFVVRKIGHLTEYAILGILLWRAFWRGSSWHFRMSILFVLALFGCAVFAATDEFHQSFVPSRTASPIDVTIDIFGALIGLMFCVAAARRKVLKEKNV